MSLRTRAGGVLLSLVSIATVIGPARSFAFTTLPPTSSSPIVWHAKLRPLSSRDYKPRRLTLGVAGADHDVEKPNLNGRGKETSVLKQVETSDNTVADSIQDDKKMKKKSLNPTPALFSLVENVGGSSGPAGTAAAAVVASVALAMVLFLSPAPAFAAMSGGRMGGSFSSSSPSSRSISPSGSTRSYGGGGYSQGYRSGFGSGFGTGYYSRPSVTVSPFPVSPFVSPFYSPFSFPRPLVYGGPGVISYNRGPSLFDLIVLGGIGFMIWTAIRGASDAASDAASNLFSIDDNNWSDGIASALGSGTSVSQISIAMDVPDRDDRSSILSVLNRLSNTARTDSRVGVQNLTSQVALELLRRKSSIVSAYTSYRHFGTRGKAQRHFNSLSTKERSKFEQEIVSKYGGVDYGMDNSVAAAAASSAVDKATMAVITLVIAIDGDSTKLPTASSIANVEDALRKIASDSKVDDCLQSAEILWTPEDRTETLTPKDVIADYPELCAV